MKVQKQQKVTYKRKTKYHMRHGKDESLALTWRCCLTTWRCWKTELGGCQMEVNWTEMAQHRRTQVHHTCWCAPLVQQGGPCQRNAVILAGCMGWPHWPDIQAQGCSVPCRSGKTLCTEFWPQMEASARIPAPVRYDHGHGLLGWICLDQLIYALRRSIGNQSTSLSIHPCINQSINHIIT